MLLSGSQDRRGKILRIAVAFAATGCLALTGCTSSVNTTVAWPQAEFVITPLAAKIVTELPAGPLYWHVESFPALADAKAAAGPFSLATDVEGKVRLFTLGPKGTPTNGGTRITEIGPLADISASKYLLRISHGVAVPGARSKVHTHPVAEAFFVLEGQLSQKTPHGWNIVGAGEALAGGGPEHPMEVTSSGGVDLDELIMLVMDADKPFLLPERRHGAG